MIEDCLLNYYRCPEQYVRFTVEKPLSTATGYFRLGQDTLFGNCRGQPSSRPTGDLYDALEDATDSNGNTQLPFDPREITDNLRYERYAINGDPLVSMIKRAYYLARPALPVGIRKHAQRLYLRNWRTLPFPAWPVDRTVDNLFETLLLLALRAQGVEKIPFIWFWPDGASSCAMMTHDVETAAGRDFCSALMNVDDEFGIKSSFQIVPEHRYTLPHTFMEHIRGREFEVNLQDLNHDGLLFSSRQTFLSRVKKINAYGRQFGIEGFRSAILYRRQDWYEELGFAYDMSVPNVAHLDPQRGGCCTVMPYFVGRILELPTTTTQDYSLFHILGDYSIDLWRRQIDLIMEKHGLITFVVHPDYIQERRAWGIYTALLAHLTSMRNANKLWIAKPGEVNRWWRQRAAMRLVENGGRWQIEGEDNERARLAFAFERDGHLAISCDEAKATEAIAVQ